jgi:gliding motility-associated-like protein
LSGYQNATAYSTTNNPTLYSVQITDEYGCVQTLTTYVDLYDTPSITVSPAVYAVVGDTTLISAYGNGTISWSPNYNISCLECTDALVWPDVEYIYTATITDANGCKNAAPIPIYYDPLIYVPNVFTPNGDQFNNVFKAEGLNILSYQMYIFNRWGELVKTLNSIDESWDGSYQGSLVLDDVYIWQIKYIDLKNTAHVLRGHVTVLK